MRIAPRTKNRKRIGARKAKSSKQTVSKSFAKSKWIDGLKGGCKAACRCGAPGLVLVAAVTRAVKVLEDPNRGEHELSPFGPSASKHAMLKSDRVDGGLVGQIGHKADLPEQAAPRILHGPGHALVQEEARHGNEQAVDRVRRGHPSMLSRKSVG